MKFLGLRQERFGEFWGKVKIMKIKPPAPQYPPAAQYYNS